jgi:hypothetical protein
MVLAGHVKSAWLNLKEKLEVWSDGQVRSGGSERLSIGSQRDTGEFNMSVGQVKSGWLEQ